MELFNRIGPWIAVGVLLASVLFFCIFYILRVIKTRKTAAPVAEADKTPDNIGAVKTIISKEQQKKLKAEIVHDIVADITPVLEKRLEKAF